MSEDASGSDPGEDDPESRDTVDETAFEWGVVEPETDGADRFSIDERGHDDLGEGSDRVPMNPGGWDVETAAGERDGEPDEDGDDEVDEHAGPEPGSTPIEPGNPTLENVMFVVLGVLTMVLVLGRLVSLGFG